MRVFIAFSLLAFSLAAQGQLYRWTDDSGKVHYTDTQPPASAKNVEKKGPARVQGAPAASTQQPYALQQAVKTFPVTVYTSKECADPCKKGLAYLKKRGVPFTEKVVATQEEIDEVAKLAGGEPRVPVMVVGVSVQKDFDERGWSDALDTAGYPKSATP
jgi:glutaredoxin